MASTVVATGLTFAAAGLAGHYVLQAMKHTESQVKQVFQCLPKYAFNGGCYRDDGLESKMMKWEAALILGISPTANKGKIRDAHQWIMLLSHPDKGGSPYIAAKITEAKDLPKGQAKKWSKCVMNFKFLLVYVYKCQVFIIKCPKATNFKNDLAQAKTKLWYKFLLWIWVFLNQLIEYLEI